MKNIKSFNAARRAGVTVEVVIAIILALSVLFLVLGLFSDNLKTIADNAGINNLVKKDTSTVTANAKLNKNYTNSVVNVQIAGQQGLQWFMNNTQKQIDVLNTKSTTGAVVAPATTGLSAADQIDLAKYFTAKSMLIKWGVPIPDGLGTGASPSNPWPTAEQQLSHKNGICGTNNLPIQLDDVVWIDSPTQGGVKEINYIDKTAGVNFMLDFYRVESNAAARAKYLGQAMGNFDKEKATVPVSGQ